MAALLGMDQVPPRRGRPSTRDGSSFGAGAIVGVLGGLIGLGGAEFHLPLLLGWF